MCCQCVQTTAGNYIQAHVALFVIRDSWHRGGNLSEHAISFWKTTNGPDVVLTVSFMRADKPARVLQPRLMWKVTR